MRVNIIDPKLLSDRHLIAESRELLIPFGMNAKYGKPKTEVKDFTLGKGHINFFRTRGDYLIKRWWDIQAELKNRGFTYRTTFPFDSIPSWSLGDWTPTEKDKAIVLARIEDRIRAKVKLYRYNRVPIVLDDFLIKMNS